MPKQEFQGGAAIGALRQIVVARSDDEAAAIAGPAAEHHVASLNWLRPKHGVNEHTARLNVPRSLDFKGMVGEGTLIVGTPKTVLAEIRRQISEMELTYLLAYMFFGTMTLGQALASPDLFRTEVLPELHAID